MIRFLVLMAIIVQVTSARAKDIYYGSMLEVVNIAQETIFRFPLPVRTISPIRRFEIRPADSESPDYSVLSIRPLFSKGEQKVVFILSDGSLVKIRLRIVNKVAHGVGPFIDLKRKSELIESRDDSLPKVSAIDFMKSMDRDGHIMGYKRKVSNLQIDTGSIKGIMATVVRTYVGNDYKGFVIELQNRDENKDYKVEVDKLYFKHQQAILSLVDRKILSSGKYPNKTLLKVVAKADARIEEIVLPLSILTKKEVK